MMRSWRFSDWLGVGALGLLALCPLASRAADLSTCLNQTGYAMEEIDSATVANGSIVWASDMGAVASCDPPQTLNIAITSSGGAAFSHYLAGFGVRTSTGALSTPNSNLASSGRMRIEQYFRFEVVTDDPSETDPVPITIVARHRFGDVSAEVSGRGQAGTDHVGWYQLKQFGATGTNIVAPWSSEGNFASTGAMFDIVKEVEVPPNRALYFRALLSQNSWAYGYAGTPPGSGGSSASSEVTYSISTDAAATVVFAVEEALGIVPPELDVLPVPEPGTASMTALVIGALGALREHRRSRW